jgi:hypothetical protein
MGVILKAEDTKGYFQWTAIGIEKPENRRIYVYDFEKMDVQKVSRENVIKLLHKRWQDVASLFFSNFPTIQAFSYTDAKTGKEKTVNRGEVSDFRRPYIPIPELE